MNCAIKTEISNPQAKAFAFVAQKTMYGAKHIAEGDTIFLFASENEGGHGLVARGVITSAEAIPRKLGVERQTPRVSVAIERTALAKRALGRKELISSSDEQDRRRFGRSGGVPRRILLGERGGRTVLLARRHIAQVMRYSWILEFTCVDLRVHFMRLHQGRVRGSRRTPFRSPAQQ